MDNFIEKWKTDHKYQTKVKLGLSTLFVIFASAFAISNRPATMGTNTQIDYVNPLTTAKITIPTEYDYVINIKENENNYKYTGSKTNDNETIIKEVEKDITEYIYQGKTYYKESIGIENVVTKEEVYDIVNYNYINLETINEYLKISKKSDGVYKTYIKDIVLGNDSDEYITITIEDNKTTIDYTALIKNFDKTIENYEIEYIIEEKE